MASRRAGLALQRSFFCAGDRVCCAVSGGADSVGLLLALHEANAARESLGLVLSAVHVHHGLRGDAADADEVFVRGFCAGLDVPLLVERVDTAGRQAAESEGVEAAARALRYAVFRSLLQAGRADAVATAHTLDDQAETVLLKMMRGAWTEGLSGISPELAGQGTGHREPAVREPAVRRREAMVGGDAWGARRRSERIVRPLLHVRRAEVEEFLRTRGQGWREDESNRDVRLTRNRVRHELMPLLQAFNPAIDTLLAQTAEIARDEEAFWAAEVARVLPQLLLPGTPVRGGGRAVGTQAEERTVAMEIARLKALPRAVQRRVLRAAVRELGVRLTGEETARLMALAGLAEHAVVTARIGARLELRDGLRAERSARELRLWGRFGARADESGDFFRASLPGPE